MAAPAVGDDPALAPLASERAALEAEVVALRARKPDLPAAEYARQLERLLVELARVSRELRRRAESD